MESNQHQNTPNRRQKCKKTTYQGSQSSALDLPPANRQMAQRRQRERKRKCKEASASASNNRPDLSDSDTSAHTMPAGAQLAYLHSKGSAQPTIAVTQRNAARREQIRPSSLPRAHSNSRHATICPEDNRDEDKDTSPTLDHH